MSRRCGVDGETCSIAQSYTHTHAHAHAHTHTYTVHSVENVPRYTANTVGACDNLIYYLVMHTRLKPDSTVDTLWVLHETR